ncbi:hypothetical protein EC80416_0545 [Escherichia coli 8.0416]|nr:hypothetical protein EC80416_0545 [Escherichia coli 8.0416]
MADAVPALASLRLSSTSFFSELKWLLSVLICWLLSATRFWVFEPPRVSWRVFYL